MSVWLLLLLPAAYVGWLLIKRWTDYVPPAPKGVRGTWGRWDMGDGKQMAWDPKLERDVLDGESAEEMADRLDREPH